MTNGAPRRRIPLRQNRSQACLVAALLRTGDYSWTLTDAAGRYVGAFGGSPDHVLPSAELLLLTRLGISGGTWEPADADRYCFRVHGQSRSSRQRLWSTLRVWR